MYGSTPRNPISWWKKRSIDELLTGCHNLKTTTVGQAKTWRARMMRLLHPAPTIPTHPITSLMAANQIHPAANPTDWEDTIAE